VTTAVHRPERTSAVGAVETTKRRTASLSWLWSPLADDPRTTWDGGSRLYLHLVVVTTFRSGHACRRRPMLRTLEATTARSNTTTCCGENARPSQTSSASSEESWAFSGRDTTKVETNSGQLRAVSDSPLVVRGQVDPPGPGSTRSRLPCQPRRVAQEEAVELGRSQRPFGVGRVQGSPRMMASSGGLPLKQTHELADTSSESRATTRALMSSRMSVTVTACPEGSVLNFRRAGARHVCNGASQAVALS
jgi:hypothetical protein